MKLSKVLAASLGALVLFGGVAATTPALAQKKGPHGGEGRTGGPGAYEVNGIGKELGLSASQKSQIGPILKSLHEQVKSVRQGSGTAEQKRSQIDSIYASATKSVNSILSSSQRQKLQSAGGLRGMFRKMGPENAPNTGFGGPMAMLNDLGVTDEQKQRLQPIFKQIGNEIEKLRASGMDREEMRPKMRAIFEKYQPKILAVLTPAQRQKMQEMRAKRRKGAGGAGTRGEKPNGF